MKARFFCDSCGASVGARADRCPACGKTFSAVRCPQCAFEGAPSQFTRGCPVCGYMAPQEGESRRAARRGRREVPISPGVARVAAVTLMLLLVVFFVIILLR